MKNRIKAYIKYGVSLIRKSKIGRFIIGEIVNSVVTSTIRTSHNNCQFKFFTPNNLNIFRVETFSTKEPETLEWIDSFSKDSVFWDIGANVGLYSCYAAKKKHCRVFAFEPSVFNHEILARNVDANNLVELVTIVPMPLSDKIGESELNMTTTNWGGALSTFGEMYGDDGKTLDKVFGFKLIGTTMDYAVEYLGLPQPKYIKIDVDGIEHLVLKGGKKVLEKAKEVLVEVNDDFKIQRENVSNYLKNSGFTLESKRHSDLIQKSDRFGNTYNQIWRHK